MSRRAISIGLTGVSVIAAISLGIVLLTGHDDVDPSELSNQEADLQQDVADVNQEVERAMSAEGLRGRSYISTAVTDNGKPREIVGATRAVQVSFGHKDSLGWYAGCNRFGATLRITAGTLLVSRIVGTEKLCSDLQQQDEWIAEFFDSDPAWRLSDQGLTLMSQGRVIKLEPDGS